MAVHKNLSASSISNNVYYHLSVYPLSFKVCKIAARLKSHFRGHSQTKASIHTMQENQEISVACENGVIIIYIYMCVCV